MKRTDLLLAIFLIIIGTFTFTFIENMFRKRTEVSNCASKYIRIIEITNAVLKNKHSN